MADNKAISQSDGLTKGLGEGLDIKLLQYIMDLKPEYKYFIWLYLPLPIIDIDDVINIHKKSKLPDYILLRKLIVHCMYHEMDLDTTINFLSEKAVIKKDSIDDMLIVEQCFGIPTKFNKLSMGIINHIIHFAKNFYQSYNTPKEAKHDQYPLVHEKNGRPILGWLKCYHFNCNYKGVNTYQLRNHLENCKAYTAYFHKSHEDAVAKLELTPEKIIGEGMTKCPSAICNKKDSIQTSEQLVAHFKRLGVPPFWKQGDIINYYPDKGDNFDVVNDKPIYSSDECVVCLDKHPTILFLDCNHHVVCLECNKNVYKCPMCDENVRTLICY